MPAHPANNNSGVYRLKSRIKADTRGPSSVSGLSKAHNRKSMNKIDVYLEVGSRRKRAAALQTLFEYGPRGGKRWSLRCFVRREAWHVLDHVWEIEDRLRNPEE